jgi:hypothetical protein
MARKGRPPVLDEGKRREILAIVSVGCSRRTAARYVGCAVTTIHNTAERDAEFGRRLRRAEQGAEVGFMRNIQKAAAKEQYWRAAAWALERINPDEFAARRPDALSLDQVTSLVVQLSEILADEVPVARHRKAVLRRVESLIAQIQNRGRTTADGTS